MIKIISPSQIAGKVKAPASKSFMQRAIALAVVNGGDMKILNPSYCDDAIAGLNIARSFGFTIDESSDYIQISKKEDVFPEEIFCGESGLAIRLFAPIAALNNKPVWLIAEGSLQNRPAGFMEETLSQLGIKYETAGGFPPIKIEGPINKNIAKVDGSISSQFLSGLLIALPVNAMDITLQVDQLMSIPYIDMTLAAIESFGGEIVHNDDYSEFKIKGNQKYNINEYFIEGDWSGAAGLLVAGAIAGEIEVDVLTTESTQADMAVLQAIENAGARIDKTKNSVKITTPERLKGFTFDALHCPDLFPVLTALAANCEGESRINGVHRLLHKESNRGEALKEEFAKVGVAIDFVGDEMIIQGGEISGGEVNAHNDHRIAMAMTLAALNASGDIIINGSECVNKTYPSFYADMQTLGAVIK